MLHCYTHTKLTQLLWDTSLQVFGIKKAKKRDHWWKKQPVLHAKFHRLYTSQLQQEECMWKRQRGKEGEVTIIFMRLVSLSFKWVFWPINCHIKRWTLSSLDKKNKLYLVPWEKKKLDQKIIQTSRALPNFVLTNAHKIYFRHWYLISLCDGKSGILEIFFRTWEKFPVLFYY